MKLNRRNALLGIGAIATGGGALFGSGAFSQVQASRDVNIGTSGDGSALLQFRRGSGASGIVNTTANNTDSGNVNVISLDQSNLNADAITVFNKALDVYNGGNSSVTFYVDDSNTYVGDVKVGNSASSKKVLGFQKGGTSTDITDSGSNPSQTMSISSQSSKEVDILVDFRGAEDANNLPSSVTFVAE